MKESYLSLMETAPEPVRRALLDRKYPAGTQILEPSARNEFIYILLSGAAEVVLEDAEGRALTLYQYGPDSLFGELELFCGNATKGIRAKTDCRLVRLRYELALEWMRLDFAFTYRLCGDLAAKLLDLTKTTQRLNMLPLRIRVLERLYLEYQAGELAELTRQDLADRVGAPIRSVNRVLRECLDQGWIAYRDKQFSIPDPGALGRMLEQYRIDE